ncbi:unnamed protein product [Paramecium sonneborni]|uniref:EF-hand domain-containing protein n=1 Tax=Paramecium sonneborni TaxID=65129 RepID=A0A8S1NJ34_9CILI|nr:unnamed protein product [Paramecium sonneborni]
MIDNQNYRQETEQQSNKLINRLRNIPTTDLETVIQPSKKCIFQKRQKLISQSLEQQNCSDFELSAKTRQCYQYTIKNYELLDISEFIKSIQVLKKDLKIQMINIYTLIGTEIAAQVITMSLQKNFNFSFKLKKYYLKQKQIIQFRMILVIYVQRIKQNLFSLIQNLMNFYFFIQYTVEAEAKLEEIRMLLASYDCFEPFTTYKRLDQSRTGGLKPENILEFLNDNEIQITEEQLYYIFRILDEDMDGLVTYQDFKSAILPKMNEKVKDSALNHRGFELPVNMLLPKEVETQLSQFFIQIKQNYVQYQQIQEKIDLNQLDIYDNDNQITVDSLKVWLQQLGQEISKEILETFVFLIQGQQQQLQNLLDQIYIENQEYQDHQQEQQGVEYRQGKEYKDKENQEEEIEQFEQYDEIEQVKQQNEDVNEQQNQQEYLYRQDIEKNNFDSRNLQKNIEFQIQQLKKKINKLEIEIESQQTNKSYIGQLFEKEYNRELQKLSRMSYLKKLQLLSPSKRNDLIRQQLKIEEEIKKEEIKQKIILTQLKNPVKTNSSSYYQNQYESQSPLNQSKKKYIPDYSGKKQIGSTRKPYSTQPQRLINFSNRKF